MLLVCFEYNFARLLRYADLSALARDYDLVISPTWSPPFDFFSMLLAARWPGKLVTMLSNHGDASVHPRFMRNASVVPLLASSWVHPELMASDDTVAKTADVVMIASFAPYKRHFALFRALRQLRVPLRVRLIGIPMDGRTAEDIRELAAVYGVAEQVEIMETLSSDPAASARWVASRAREAKVGLILSRREGSCVAVAEMMLMGLPVLMLSDAHVGSKAFITPDTGALTTESALASAMTAMVKRAPGKSPRDAMLEAGHECFGSTKRLNDALKKVTLEAGGRWTRDIVPHALVRLEPRFVSDADVAAVKQDYEDFGQRYGVELRLPKRVDESADAADAPVSAGNVVLPDPWARSLVR